MGLLQPLQRVTNLQENTAAEFLWALCWAQSNGAMPYTQNKLRAIKILPITEFSALCTSVFHAGKSAL